MDLECFLETTRVDIENRLSERIDSYEEPDKLKYFLNTGKRFRPLLCVLTYWASGGDERRYGDVLNLAAAIELQHCASLVHDDIIDGDAQRRNHASFHKAFGVDEAILTGHRAIMLGFKSILNRDPKIVRTLFEVWDESLKGELADVKSRRNLTSLLSQGEKLYFDVIYSKTASLFAGAAKVGCQEAAGPATLQDLFWEYGKNIGVAYQLADDSEDFKVSNETLPLVWILKSLDEGSGRLLVDFIEKQGIKPADAFVMLNISPDALFKKEILRLQGISKNLASSDVIPDSKFKDFLADFVDYIMGHNLENQC